jgi:16S rRNA (guanine(966)-N(2))-methyltransferase RsmD
MRIIGGKWKGHPIPVDKKFNGRPTTDFAREGLMNTLHHMLDWGSSSVLDMFTGTGAFALECMSRGAEQTLALDIQHHHISHLSRVAKDWKIDRLQCIKTNSFDWIQNQSKSFDVIFADPPFDHPQLAQLPELCIPHLTDSGLFILEHNDHFSFHDHDCFLKEKKYGHVHFSFFTKLAV